MLCAAVNIRNLRYCIISANIGEQVNVLSGTKSLMVMLDRTVTLCRFFVVEL